MEEFTSGLQIQPVSACTSGHTYISYLLTSSTTFVHKELGMSVASRRHGCPSGRIPDIVCWFTRDAAGSGTCWGSGNVVLVLSRNIGTWYRGTCTLTCLGDRRDKICPRQGECHPKITTLIASQTFVFGRHIVYEWYASGRRSLAQSSRRATEAFGCGSSLGFDDCKLCLGRLLDVLEGMA
jgi:hypothetical protein